MKRLKEQNQDKIDMEANEQAIEKKILKEKENKA